MMFADVKVGDLVAIVGRGSLQKRQVGRVTDAYFAVDHDETLFSCKTGAARGSSSGLWSTLWAEPWTERHAQMLSEQQSKRLRLQRINKLKNLRWDLLDDEQLGKALAILKESGLIDAMTPATAEVR